MFDRLIESGSTGADFKPRSRYFLVSSLVVGILFVSAVIFSIYAAEIGLGNDNLEISALIAPVPMPEVAPEPPRPQPQRETTQQRSEVPQRTDLIRPIDEPPVETPPISVTQNTVPPIPAGLVQLGTRNTDPPTVPITNESGTGTNNNEPSTVVTKPDSTVKTEPQPEPPPIVPAKTKYIGVANGIATYLPKPPYPPIAIQMHIDGKVDVQVTIDETGKVISAKAASGHPFLRQVAEQAARGARFTPTKLQGIPVKVTGLIVYNFTRN